MCWIFSQLGFISVVEDAEDDRVLVVRSRFPDDLETLRSRYWPRLGRTRCTPERDYPLRAAIMRPAFIAGLGRLVTDIDYTNFKRVVADEQGLGREAIYHRIWALLRGGRDLEMDLEAAEILRRSRP